MKYIKQVTSNIKSPTGEVWSVELEPRTLIVGPNTSRKSAIIQAVELATTGAADDVVGRKQVKDSSLLLTLAPGDDLVAQVVTDTNEEFSYECHRIEGKVKKPTTSLPKGSPIPLREVQGVLAGSANTVRKALLGWSAADISVDDILAHIPANLHGAYRSATANMPGTPVEQLLAYTDYAGKQSRSLAKEVKGSQTIIDDLMGKLPSRPSDHDLEEARRAVESSTQGLSPEVVESTRKELQNAQESLDAWKSHLAGLDEETHDRAVSATNLLTFALDRNMSACPTCSSEVGFDHLTNCFNYYSSQKVEEVEAAQKSIDGWQLTFSALTETLRTLESLGASDSAEALRRQGELEQVRARWDAVAQAKERQSLISNDVGQYKSAKSACEGAIARIVAATTEPFCKKVSSFLPRGWNFGIEDARVGLLRNDRLHSALSGAEWATVTTALAMAISSSGLRILIPEDRAWDPKTLASVMRGFSKFDGQVLMASTVRPKGRTPKGWKIFDMNEFNLVDTSTDEPEEAEPEVKPEVIEPDEVIERVVHDSYEDAGEKVVTSATLRRRRAASKTTDPNMTARSRRILQGLGFADDDIDTMSTTAAVEIINGGLLAEFTKVESDGSLTLMNGSDLKSLPRLR